MPTDAAEQEIVITRGEDAVIPFAAVTAADLSAATLEFSVAPHNGKAVSSGFPLATGSGITGQDSAGNFTVTIPAATTAALSAREYRWDAWRTDGTRRPIAGGPLVVKEPVRRPT